MSLDPILDPAKDALIVVDLQHDFLPGGALAVAEGDRIIPPIVALVRRFSTVIATQDFHPRGHVSFASSHPGRAAFERIELYGGLQMLWPDHCVAGTRGAALHEALPDDALTLVLRKGTRREVDSYSAFRENPGPDGARPTTGLGALLHSRGIDRVFVVGLARDYCVLATALDAAAEGFRAVVLDDLTRPVDPARAEWVDAELAAASAEHVPSAALREADTRR
jgi:nicotinamidase/pyrazinamidase